MLNMAQSAEAAEYTDCISVEGQDFRHKCLRYHIRHLKETAHMLVYSTGHCSLNWEMNTIWPIDGTLTGTATPIQGEPGSNSNEEMISNSTSLRNLNLIISCRFISYLKYLL